MGYVLKQQNQFWKIVPHAGPLPASINGLYSSRLQAHNALVIYLKSTDKFGKAVYPGSDG